MVMWPPAHTTVAGVPERSCGTVVRRAGDRTTQPGAQVNRRVVALVALVVLGVVACAADDTTEDGDGGDAAVSTAVTDADADIAVVPSSSDVDPESLAELVAISPLVVTGEVQSVERGRVFASDSESDDSGADPSEEGIESALVTVAVDQVLVGDDPGATVLVEEEGWLADGRRIALDGAPPTQVGDRGIWFLVDTGDTDVPAWVSVGRVGRWIERDGTLSGPTLDIPLAIDLQDRRLAEVVADIEAATTAP
jgi:hypothetical protein